MNTSSNDAPKLKFMGRTSQNPYIIWIAYAVFLIVGIYGSLKVVCAQFGIDSDTSHSIMLWYGVHAHNLSWIKDWAFTQDNWLLSLLPFHFAGFALFGPSPAVVILFGWVIFLCSAFISGVIAWQLQAKKAAFILSAGLLFFGFYAHEAGYLAYSTSHNITNLFGLLSFALIFSWLKKPNILKLVAALIILFAGAFSDPWMTAAYILPIALTAIVFLAFPLTFGVSRVDSLKLLVMTLCTMILIKSQLFGVLNFLPHMEFIPGNWIRINANSIVLIQDLGGLLNIAPFNKDNPFLPALLTLIILISLLVYTFLKAVKSGYSLKAQNGAFFLFATLSVGGIVAAFVISAAVAERFSARFLINCVYLIPIALAVLIEYNWPKGAKIEKATYLSVSALFVLAGIISNFHELKKPGFAFKDTGVPALIRFLKENNLTYGYGPYWGASANAVTAASKLEVVIRPVVFSPFNGMIIAGNRVESAKDWYTEADFPANQKQYFVLVTRDFENCPDVNVCINGITRQFGKPAKTLKYNDATILVWDHPLLDYHRNQYPITFDAPLIFNSWNNPPILTGWFAPEEWGTWSSGETSFMHLVMQSTPKKDLELLIGSQAFLAPNHPTQEVEIIVNGEKVGTLKYSLEFNGGVRKITIPKALVLKDKGDLFIQFRIKNPKSPAELGLSADSRKLGIGLMTLELN